MPFAIARLQTAGPDPVGDGYSFTGYYNVTDGEGNTYSGSWGGSGIDIAIADLYKTEQIIVDAVVAKIYDDNAITVAPNDVKILGLWR